MLSIQPDENNGIILSDTATMATRRVVASWCIVDKAGNETCKIVLDVLHSTSLQTVVVKPLLFALPKLENVINVIHPPKRGNSPWRLFLITKIRLSTLCHDGTVTSQSPSKARRRVVFFIVSISSQRQEEN